MPFDGRDNTPALNRARLIEALRAEMPAGFEWYFGDVLIQTDCGTAGCALGLASIIWPEQKKWLTDGRYDREVEAFFGLLQNDACDIFWGSSDDYGDLSLDDITPAMVADALERLS